MAPLHTEVNTDLRFPSHPQLGKPHQVWPYTFADGRPFCSVARWNLSGGKEIRQFHIADGKVCWERPKGLAPLFRLPEVVNAPALLIVAGEKAADAGRKLFPHLLTTTSLGGENAFTKTDWSAVKGRVVIIWPDADEPGIKYAMSVARLCKEAGAASVRIVEVPISAPKGWDIADDAPEGWRLEEFIENAIEFKLSDWYRKAMTGTRGHVLNNLSNALLALRCDPEFDSRLTYNEFTDEELLDGLSITDSNIVHIQAWMQLAGLPSMSSSTVFDAVSVVTRENGFHPIRDYLDDLKWDGTLRVEKWLSQYLGAEHNEYSINIGRMVLISMITRVFEPGCKVDNSLVLEAPQGAGKSTVAKVLAGGDAHFSDSLCDDLSSKDAMHHLAGKWIVEMAELSQFNKSDQTALKKFLTKTHDKFRPAYGRKEVSRARQCIFIGTTNEHKYLKDSTGNRRYWPIKCGHIELDLLQSDRDQLLAEALIYYRAGDLWYPTREFEARYMAAEQDARYDHDVWHEQVAKWLDGVDRAVTVLEILSSCLGMDLDNANNAHGKRIVGILQSLGWIPGRSKKAKFWIKR